jgi:hypothetical protein
VGARPISGKWTPYSTAPTPPQNILIRNGTQSGNGSNSDSGDAD